MFHCGGLFSLPWPLMLAYQPATPSTHTPASSKSSPAFGASPSGHTHPGSSVPEREHTLKVHMSTAGQAHGELPLGCTQPSRPGLCAHPLGSSLCSPCSDLTRGTSLAPADTQPPAQALLPLQPLDEREPEQRENNHILPKLNH